jgi:hypothetical protein
LALNGLADYIIEQWMAEISTWKGINSIHNTMVNRQEIKMGFLLGNIQFHSIAISE